MEPMYPNSRAATYGLFTGELAVPWNRFLVDLPQDVAAIPSMMSVGERKFLYGLAKDYYTGAGRIIDAGTFLGASTRCFGAGLQKNATYDRTRWPSPVISFDMA